MSRVDKMQGNENAKKPDEEKITGKGRIVIDLGDLKGEAVRASRAREMKLAPWIREAVEEKIARENVNESGSSTSFFG